MSQLLRLGILAASSCVPQVEFQIGLQRLHDAGFETLVTEQCHSQSFTFAGADEERASALWKLATDESIDILWCARGGYGATRLLPLLNNFTNRHGPPPKKLLVGYSDVTVLHEFVRSNWNWATLHAEMPGTRSFIQLHPDQWAAILRAIHRNPIPEPWSPHRLEFISNPPATSIRASLVGGNLTLWAALCGTPFQPSTHGKMLFFEDIGETWYRIDRMINQLLQAGAFTGAKAILLGDFKECPDENTMVLKEKDSSERIPLRRVYSQRECMQETFGHLANQLQIPIALGLPVGHGPNFWPLALGADYQLTNDAQLKMINWDWAA
ncbi:MAG TPA: LD-carboxypeptidase [Tepidisphaeraceae bacterium]|jgi:muramoyltetrapeptide carboxypeptidase|nr:LD-carboxypeptidase [Tepidisphaeraceae bacterium]